MGLMRAMSYSTYSGWSADRLRAAIEEKQQQLASSAAAVSSPDGTSVRFREEADIKQAIQDMLAALDLVESGQAPRRASRRTYQGYGRGRRWMR